MTYVQTVLAHFQKWLYFTTRDARLQLKTKKTSAEYVKLLLHALVKKGKIHSIGKGTYTMQNDAIVAGFAFQPFYYGLHFALTHYHLWTQVSNPVIITTRHVRTGTRELMGTNFVIRKINPKLFFGYETIEHYDYWIPVSTPEKTLIDFVYFRQKIPKEALKNLLQKINQKKLYTLLKKTPKWAKKRVKALIHTKKKSLAGYLATKKKVTGKEALKGLREKKGPILNFQNVPHATPLER